MTRFERIVIGAILATIAVLVTADLIGDARTGAPLWHLLVEAAVAAGAAMGVVFLFRDQVVLKRDLKIAHQDALRHQQDLQVWRSRARLHSEGLSAAIHAQLEAWGLTVSEKEIAFMLLKGLSLREIAVIRGTSEKTARAQATAIYQKSGLQGRADLAAFFLEDLLG